MAVDNVYYDKKVEVIDGMIQKMSRKSPENDQETTDIAESRRSFGKFLWQNQICCFSKWHICFHWHWKYVILHQDFDHMTSRSWDIDWNRFFYGFSMKIQIWPPSAAFLNITVVFIDPRNTCLDTPQQMLRNQDFYRMSLRVWDIEWNRFQHVCHLENPIWPSSDAFSRWHSCIIWPRKHIPKYNTPRFRLHITKKLRYLLK